MATSSIGAAAPESAHGMKDVGAYGPPSPRLVVEPGTHLDVLACEAEFLVKNALAVFEVMADAEVVSDLHFAGLHLLRQACIVVSALQMTPAQSEAAMAAGEAA